MAQAIFEKRKFTNQQTGETINYEVYAIVSDVDGERMELALKSLTPAEKIAFKMLLTGNDPVELHVAARGSNEEEKNAFLKQYQDKNENEEDDEL